MKRNQIFNFRIAYFPGGIISIDAIEKASLQRYREDDHFSHHGLKSPFPPAVQDDMKPIENDSDPCPVCGTPGIFSFQSRDLMFDKTEEYRYLSCCHCHSEFQSPMPGPSQIASFYPDSYEQYAPLDQLKPFSHAKTAVLKYHYGYTHLPAPPMPYRLISRLLASFFYKDTLPYIENGRVLDVGCGNGRYIRRMNSLGWRCEGVEFNETAVNVCRQAGLKVFHGELKNAHFADDFFDLVTARQLIEHLPDPIGFVQEITRILKPGGRFVVITPNNLSLGKKLFGKRWFANEVPRHLVLFNADSLSMLLTKYGYRLVSRQTSSSPKMLLNSWDYLVDNQRPPFAQEKDQTLFGTPGCIPRSTFQQG